VDQNGPPSDGTERNSLAFTRARQRGLPLASSGCNWRPAFSWCRGRPEISRHSLENWICLYQEVSNSVGAGFDPGKGGCRGEHLCSATVSPVRANRDQLMRSMCWGGGWGNAARYWKAHRAEPGPFGLSANTSASVPAWCVAADLSDAKAAAGGHSFGMRGSTSSPNSRIDACASASAISLKLTCSEAISKSPIC
jgi:hypothetical protein